MSLGYPTGQGTYETQQFGPSPLSQEPEMYASDSLAAWWQPYKGWLHHPRYHNGLDIAGVVGTPLLAMESGIVNYSGWRDNGGGLVIDVEIKAGTVYSFAHCSALLVASGKFVSRGQAIARIGNTGNTTGPHTHVGVAINEVGPDGYSRDIKWNPKLFMAGGAYANDARIKPFALPDTTTPPPPAGATTYPSTEGNLMAVRFRDEDLTATILVGKPYRDTPTVAGKVLGYWPHTQGVHLIGRHDATGSYDTWHLTKVYRGNGYGFAWVTSVDFAK